MSTIQYTEEQQKALTTRKTGVALDAGAGCGKTFVLTERYLSHLDPDWNDGQPATLDQVVAITFTDAAAREMRNRIRLKCRERLAGANSKQAPFWRNLIQSLDGARVSTIHAFCAKLLRQHAVQLGIDPAFRVLDGPAAQVLRNETLDATLRQRLLLSGRETDNDLVQAAADLGLDQLKEVLRTFANGANQPGFLAWSKQTPEACVEAWLSYYREHVAPFYVEQFLQQLCTQRLRELLPMATPVTPRFADRVAELSERLENLTTSEAPHEELLAIEPLLQSQENRKPYYTDKDWPDPEIKKNFTAVLKELRTLLNRQKNPGWEEASFRTATLGLRLQRLAIIAREDYTREKRTAGLLDQDDLLYEADRLLTDPDFETEQKHIAGGIRALLVDEFQDTDQTQARIVRALVEANRPGTPGGLDDGRLFFVGDFKQSIYRFRKADPQVFRELREATPKSGRLPLSTNFRSQPAVLDFINTLFSRIFGDDYEPLKPKKAQQTPSPAVEFLWTPWHGAEKPKVEQTRRAEAQTIVARLRALIDSGEPVVLDADSKEPRAARPGDIALLFRALSDVPLYEEALRKAGLDYYLVGGHTFYAQQEVYDLVNLLQVVENACDDLALAGVLRSPFFGLHDETLFWLAQRGGLNNGLARRDPPEQLDADQALRLTHARKTLLTLRNLKDQVSVTELIQAALEQTAYDAILLAEFLGDRKLANLEKLIQQARQSDAAGGNLSTYLRQLREFINRPPKEGHAATRPEEADVVRLMTVHGAKGLEFPIVVLPDLNRKAKPNHPQAAYHPELGPLIKPPVVWNVESAVGMDLYRTLDNQAEEQERARLFYVACTRAADRLILSSTIADFEKLEGAWLKLLAQRFDLQSGQRIRDESIEEGEADPLVRIPSMPEKTTEAKPSRGVDLSKVLAKAVAAAKKPIPPESAAGRVAMLPEAIQTFSVSRLSGKLRRTFHEADSQAETTEALDPRALGTLVHAVVERLNLAAPPDRALDEATRWAKALAPRLVRRRPDLAADEACRLTARLLASETWSQMATANRLEREVEFLLAWPPETNRQEALLRGYMDAMHRDTAGHWHVVDYKTNQIDTKGAPQAAEQYHLQMGVYALAVEQATGEPPTSLTLFFLRPGVAQTLPWNDATRLETIQQVNQAIQEARTETVQASRS